MTERKHRRYPWHICDIQPVGVFAWIASSAQCCVFAADISNTPSPQPPRDESKQYVFLINSLGFLRTVFSSFYGYVGFSITIRRVFLCYWFKRMLHHVAEKWKCDVNYVMLHISLFYKQLKTFVVCSLPKRNVIYDDMWMKRVLYLINCKHFYRRAPYNIFHSQGKKDYL